MTEEVNLGFIGCGGFSGGNLYPVLQYAPVNLVAVCDAEEERAHEYAARYGFRSAYTNHLAMFEKEDLDAVMIVTGPKGHYPLSLDAMHAGLHVYVEKPPSTTAEDALEMVEVSRETCKYLQVGFMKRFATGNLMAKQAACTEAFGRPVMMDVKYVSSPYEVNDPRAFIRDYHVHPFDLVRFFLGDVQRLLCRRVDTGDGRTGDNISMVHTNGAVSYLNVNCFQGWGNVGDRVELTGENQYVVVENLLKATLFRNPQIPCDRVPEFLPETDALTWEPNWLFPVPQNSSPFHVGYAREVIHFAESILNGTFTGPDAVDGYKAMELVEATWESIQQGREVEVKDALRET